MSVASSSRRCSSEAASSARNLASGSQELSATAEQLSQGATEQASSTEEASASMEEMASTIKQSADNASQTEKIARQSAADALASGEAVANAVSAMVITRHLHELRRCPFLSDQTAGSMHGERGGIMIGMPAFIGMGQNNGRMDLLDQFQKGEGQSWQIEGNLLVHALQPASSPRLYPAPAQRGVKFQEARLGVFGLGVEARATRVQ